MKRSKKLPKNLITQPFANMRQAIFTQLSENWWRLVVDSDKKYYGTKTECEINLITNHCGFGRFNVEYYPQKDNKCLK